MDPLFDFTGKVALVTGGSRGLGLQMVMALAERGADVIIASRKIDACREVAEQVRMLGGHGSSSKYVHDVVGMNSRLDAIQAVVLSAKLKRLPRWNGLRREAAARYGNLLAGVPGITLPMPMPEGESVWHLYVVQVDGRDRVLEAMHKSGIGAGIHYPTPVHLTKAFSYLGRGMGDFPVAETAAGRILTLPIFPHVTAEQQERVVASLRHAVAGA